MNTFCTIITQSYLPFAEALKSSLAKFNSDIILNVLIVDGGENKICSNNLNVIYMRDILESSSIGKQIVNKYSSPEEVDLLRWSLKPILINYLLEDGYDKVIFTDPDTYYFSDYSFLFEELERSNIVLTPHWRGLTPKDNETNFNLQFVGGLFNAGFIGVNNQGKTAMDWWAEMCLYKCVKDISVGHFVDQTYLNLLPIYFDKVQIIKHKGCNVANWNQQQCKRTKKKDMPTWILDKYPIVFIHFTSSTIKGIQVGEDHLLKHNLEEYNQKLLKYGWPQDILFSDNNDFNTPEKKQKLVTRFKKKLRI